MTHLKQNKLFTLIKNEHTEGVRETRLCDSVDGKSNLPACRLAGVTPDLHTVFSSLRVSAVNFATMRFICNFMQCIDSISHVNAPVGNLRID